MSKIDEAEVVDFIRTKGNYQFFISFEKLRWFKKQKFYLGGKGPEGNHSGDGQYDYFLIEPSAKSGSTNMNTLNICPNFKS